MNVPIDPSHLLAFAETAVLSFARSLVVALVRSIRCQPNTRSFPLIEVAILLQPTRPFEVEGDLVATYPPFSVHTHPQTISRKRHLQRLDSVFPDAKPNPCLDEAV